jgi:hypothetical protein
MAAVVVAPLVADAGAQVVDAAHQVLVLPAAEAVVAVAGVEVDQLAELGAQADGFAPVEQAAVDAAFDALLQVAEALVDGVAAAVRLGGGGKGDGQGRERSGREQNLFHGQFLCLSTAPDRRR